MKSRPGPVTTYNVTPLRSRESESTRPMLTSLAITYEYEQEINPQTKYTKHELLGSGNFGSVFRITLITDESPCYALKIPKRNDSGISKGAFEASYEHEIQILMLLGTDSPGLISFHGLLEPNKMLLSFAPEGTLSTFIEKTYPVSFTNKINCITFFNRNVRENIANSLIEAINYLHDILKIAHLDIKTDNVLLDKKFRAKLTDFGTARVLKNIKSSPSETPQGTRAWWPPEIITKNYPEDQLSEDQAKSQDIFALGAIINLVSGAIEGYPGMRALTEEKCLIGLIGAQQCWAKEYSDSFYRALKSKPLLLKESHTMSHYLLLLVAQCCVAPNDTRPKKILPATSDNIHFWRKAYSNVTEAARSHAQLARL